MGEFGVGGDCASVFLNGSMVSIPNTEKGNFTMKSLVLCSSILYIEGKTSLGEIRILIPYHFKRLLYLAPDF